MCMACVVYVYIYVSVYVYTGTSISMCVYRDVMYTCSYIYMYMRVCMWADLVGPV